MPLRLVILAAGASERLGEPKAIARLGPRTALEHLLFAGSALDARPLVIVGKHAREIANAAPKACEVLVHPNWERGRSSTIALAHAHAPECDLCLAPVDVPLVASAVFTALRDAWFDLGQPPRGWLAPFHTGLRRHGHPVIVGRVLLDRLTEDFSLRDLRALADPCRDVPVQDDAVLDDLDTPEDLKSLRRRFD